jgi:hypothetical protein
MKRPPKVRDTYVGMASWYGRGRLHGRKQSATSPKSPTTVYSDMYHQRNNNGYLNFEERRIPYMSRCGHYVREWQKWGNVDAFPRSITGLCQHCFPGVQIDVGLAPWRPIEYGYHLSERGYVTAHIMRTDTSPLCGHWAFSRVRLPWMQKTIAKYAGDVPICKNCERVDLSVEGSVYRELLRRT